jgi:hypothetical protein
MKSGKKGALLLLAVVVFWATAPASACLLGTRSSHLHNCCRAMARACKSASMTADSSCCRVSGQNPAVTPVPPYSPEHTQDLVLAPQLVNAQLPAASGADYGNAFDAPPPKFPPGGAFALRI